MRTTFLIVALLVGSQLCWLGCSRDPAASDRALEVRSAAVKLRPLHRKLGEPRPGEWLASHDEPGQTFVEYVNNDPSVASGKRRIIYVQPLGPFTEKQREIVELSAEYLGLYYNCEVKICADLPLSVIPQEAQRLHPKSGVKQIRASYVLKELLYTDLPDDAAGCIAVTATDIRPGNDWNYVFGVAAGNTRTGLWSMYRNGDPADSEEAFDLCLRRTLKTASHETGHMLSLKHCTAFECNMCGYSAAQYDRLPLYLCPQCVAKVCWATDADVVERYRKLANFCEAHGLSDEQEFYENSIEALIE